MTLKTLRPDLLAYLKSRGLLKKWQKAVLLFNGNIRHPSLKVELLRPKWRGIYSFRIDKKYRALFFIDRIGDLHKVKAYLAEKIGEEVVVCWE